MKKLFLLLILLSIPVLLFSAPFGFSMGMSLDDLTQACGGLEPMHRKDDCYFVIPVKKHPLFDIYEVFVDGDKGLYCIKAHSNFVFTNRYGTEIQNAFSEIKERISKTYGQPRIIDEITSDSLFKDAEHWAYSLADGARTYAAIWESSENNKLKDDLTEVSIHAEAGRDPLAGWFILEYDFNNMQAVQDAQDDVF